MNDQERQAERRESAQLLAQAGGEALLRMLRRRWRDGPTGETEHQMLNRLGRLDALADLERLREEGKGS